MADPVAVYAAVIGTAGAAGATWSIWHGIVRDRSRIRIAIKLAQVQNYPGIRPDEWLRTLDVMNHGRRPVTISSLPGLNFPDGMTLVFSPWPGVTGPQTLGEGQKLTYWMYEFAFKDGLRERGCLPTRVVVKDDAGEEHKRRINGSLLKWMRSVLEESPAQMEEETQS